MNFKLSITSFIAISLLLLRTFDAATSHRLHSHAPHLMMDKSHVEEKEHIMEHLEGVVDSTFDINKMAEEELRFLYFKMHDNDDNNKLDGCELIKSLLHWHVEESKMAGGIENGGIGTTKIFGNEELALMIDPILSSDDKNRDGFIDYSEFVAAQKARGF